jgi:hypothetical protein
MDEGEEMRLAECRDSHVILSRCCVRLFWTFIIDQEAGLGYKPASRSRVEAVGGSYYRAGYRLVDGDADVEPLIRLVA